MPQMSPLKWLMLYMFFSGIFILFCIMNYYSFLPPTPQMKNLEQINQPPMNWKW